MSGNKFQVVAVAGLVVSAGLVLQAAMPRLANDSGLLFLRAQYKLATGDTGSALKLMQQAATSPGTQPQPKALRQMPASVCPYSHAKPIATSAKEVSARPQVVSVAQPVTAKAHVRRLAVTIPNWRVEQMQTLARVQAIQAEQQARVHETMVKLEAQLRDLPRAGAAVTIQVPAVPATPVVLGTRAGLP